MRYAAKQSAISLYPQPNLNQRSPFDSQKLESMIGSGSSLSLSVQPDTCQVNWQSGAQAGDRRSLNLNLEGIGSNTPNALSQTLRSINSWISDWLGGQPTSNATNATNATNQQSIQQQSIQQQSIQLFQPRADSLDNQAQPALPQSPKGLKADATLRSDVANPNQMGHDSSQKDNARNVTIQRGDTLWNIAQTQLGDGNRWQELRKPDGSQFQPAEVANLRVGDQVVLPDGNQAAPVPGLSNKSNGVEQGSYEPKVDREFLNKVKGIGDRLQVAPEYLMAVMGFETGGSYSPSVKNKAGSGATGLIQFMPDTAKGLGTSTEQLAKMSPTRQLDYVEKYMSRQAGRLKSLEDVYMAVLYPKAVGQSSDSAIFNKGTKQYTQNAGLDVNKDGKVTPAEATEKVRKFLPKAGIFNA